MNLESVTLFLSIVFLGVSLVFYAWRFLAVRSAKMQTTAGNKLPNYLYLAMLVCSLIAITISLAARAIYTGHGPFSSMYEFAAAFSWGIVIFGLYFWRRYKMPVVSVIAALIALGLLIFARSMPSRAAPLVPALQQSLLLTTHVACAVISYGAFTVGFACAIIYLIRGNAGKESQKLDEASYHSVLIGFPFMTLVIVLGALWADIAWGKYWSWDPKETASLVTWLLYAAYLHARVMRGWRGKRAAILLIIGFAAVLITFFGNYVFQGLHSYN